MASPECAVLVPVLRRPHRVKPVLDAFSSTAPCRILFLPDPDDMPERQAIAGFGAEQLPVAGNYAQKINAGVRETTEPLVFLAADDLQPHPGWFEAAKSKLDSYGWYAEVARPGCQVVGINDLLPRPHRPQHATHFLMTRAYAEQPTIDGEPGPLFQGYFSWNCDDELIATAEKRGVYAYAEDSHVEHLHPQGGKAPDDEVYELGRSHRREDSRLFRHRSQLWT